MKSTIPFLNKTTSVPIVPFSLVNGVEAYAILDTGSEVTVYDMQFVKRNRDVFETKEDSYKTKLTNVTQDGEEVPYIQTKTKLILRDSDESFKEKVVPGMVLNLSHINTHLKDTGEDLIISAIFGADMLNWLGMEISFPKQRITVR